MAGVVTPAIYDDIKSSWIEFSIEFPHPVALHFFLGGWGSGEAFVCGIGHEAW